MSRQNLSDYLSSNAPSSTLAQLILSIAEVSRAIRDDLSGGALNDILGAAGAENVQGEEQKKLDVIANERIKTALSALPSVRGIASDHFNLFRLK
tara:strand:+ start:354 stop:638 length:285 start_codon:yes stop_codon:yes gene_type:complete